MKSAAFRLKSRNKRHSSLRRHGVDAVLGKFVTSVGTVVYVVTQKIIANTDPVLALPHAREALVLA